jgi:ABC-type sugar transport system ATPase subunit
MEEEKYLIEAKDVDKSFAGVHALDHVRFNLKGGEVHALLGENGAGKSTLVKILSGVYQMDSGEIWYDGKRLAFATPKMAQDWGMGIIYQELNLCPHLTVAQNIFIGREKRNGIVLNERAQNKAAKEILAMIGGEQINPAEKVGKLTVSKQQMVEIAKALSMNTRVLIMDEPTSSMSSREIDQLFEVILKLKKQGVAVKMTVMENITIASLDQALSRRYVISRKKEACFCEDMIERLRIKTPSLEQRVRNLSGGNQQKIVFAQWLLKYPDIFFFDEPTRGIDVGAKREIYRILNELKERKKAIVLISSELPEILGVSDRVLVMCEGRVQKILDTKETTQEEIMYYASMFRPESQENQE